MNAAVSLVTARPTRSFAAILHLWVLVIENRVPTKGRGTPVCPFVKNTMDTRGCPSDEFRFVFAARSPRNLNAGSDERVGQTKLHGARLEDTTLYRSVH